MSEGAGGGRQGAGASETIWKKGNDARAGSRIIATRATLRRANAQRNAGHPAPSVDGGKRELPAQEATAIGRGMTRRLLLLVLSLALAACTAVPYTRRSQLILISPDEEAKLGAQAYREVLSKARVVRRDDVIEPVREVGQRIARVSDRNDFRWEFSVIDDPKQQNAFALPGGKVAVYTGLFPVARDTNGLAVVLGHEIAHVLARHGAERMSQGLVAQAGGTLLGAMFGGGPSAQAIMAAYGLGAQLGVLLPYSRTQESEADHIGLLLMARAGYDPSAALAFWERMEKTGGNGTPEFVSTHPSHGTRQQQIQAWLPEALRYYEASARAPVARLPG
jgi:predicted Zn-dependent protease